MNRLKCLLAAALFGGATLAHAGFSISGTRVIYHDAEGEATVQLQRTSGDAPVLLQTWLDDGDPAVQPGMQDLPFVATPAVSRVDPERAQVIRILRVRDDLPTDRETLLFFNALEVPAVSGTAPQAGSNYLRLAMQTRMKFFYRPRGLQPGVDQAADLLRFTLEAAVDKQGKQDGRLRLRLHNPTPYHLTVPKLALVAAQRGKDAPVLAQLAERAVAPMVAPFGDLVVPLDPAGPAASAARLRARRMATAQVRYSVINDMGGLNVKEATLGNAS